MSNTPNSGSLGNSPPESVTDRVRDAMTPGAKTNGDAEQQLWAGSYSGKTMAGIGILIALDSIALVVIALLLGALGAFPVIIAVAAIIGVQVIGYFVVVFYKKLSHSYELSNQRLKHRDGILVRTSNRIELIDIDDVTYKQGPIQSMLGVGNIMIRSSDATHPELVLQGIDKVKEVADLIDNARRAERRKRGIHIESI